MFGPWIKANWKWSNIPGSYAVLLFTAWDFTFITRRMHVWALFLLWLHLFILSGVISPLISSSINMAPTCLESSSVSVLSLCLFILSMGFSRQEYWSGLSFPSPVVLVLLELSAMTQLSWVALHRMAHSFIELDKALSMWSVWLVFCDYGFRSVCPLIDKD